MDADVAVVGAGPVGSAIALMLDRAGLSTVLLERSRFPRDKPCGEGLMPSGVRALAELGLGLDRFPALSGVRYRVPRAGEVDGLFPAGTCGRGTRRIVFDEMLAGAADAADKVQLVLGCECTGVTVEPAAVTVQSAAGEVRVRWLVAADGLRSRIARSMGWYRPPSGKRYALVSHLEAKGHAFDRVVVTLLPGRELYLAPTGENEVLLAVLGPKSRLRAPGEPVGEAYSRHVRDGHPELADCPRSALRGAGPFWTRPAKVAGHRVFLVGDAAGFLDPLTGDGMTAGLVAGRALAAALAASEREPEAVYRRWEAAQWRRRVFLARLALGLTGHSGLARRALRGVGRRPAALARLLEVNDGSRGLRSLSWRDWAALAGI